MMTLEHPKWQLHAVEVEKSLYFLFFFFAGGGGGFNFLFKVKFYYFKKLEKELGCSHRRKREGLGNR